MISMNDVAEKAGVSKATVSRALNARALVSSTTRKKVLSACKNLNYKLNSNIQDLVLRGRNGSTRNIAFVLVDINFSDPAYARLVDGISAAINKYHYHLTLVRLTGSEESIYDLPPVLRDERVDGILISGKMSSGITGVMKSLGSKCVVVGNYSEQMMGPLSNVQSSPALVIHEAVEKLVAQDKKRIAFIEENPGNHFGSLVLDSYKNALASANLKFNDDICYMGKGAFSGVYDLMKPVFLRKILPFDSIICYDLRIAREISHLLVGRFGLDRQIDVTVVTVRQHEYNELPVPTIYIELNLEKCIESALQLLIDQIEGRKSSQSIVVK